MINRALTMTVAAMTLAACAWDTPRHASGHDDCGACHEDTAQGGLQDSDASPSALADATRAPDQRCRGCHEALAPAGGAVSTASGEADRLDDKMFRCTTCHDPHGQAQLEAFGAESYLETCTVEGVSGSMLRCADAHWALDELVGLSVVLDVDVEMHGPPASHKILANGVDTVTLKGPLDVDESIAGATFVIVYGRSINDVVSTPNSGARATKFFGPMGTNSFADGDDVHDGICEVCHTRTAYHRNDGTGAEHHDGTDCMQCHPHEAGFGHRAGLGDLCEACGAAGVEEAAPGRFGSQAWRYRGLASEREAQGHHETAGQSGPFDGNIPTANDPGPLFGVLPAPSTRMGDSTSEEGLEAWESWRGRAGGCHFCHNDQRVGAGFEGGATIVSGAHQSFLVGSGPVPASSITIRDGRAPMISALGDIRITVPRRLRMRWDPSVTSATFVGSASSKVDASLAYENAGKTVVINVLDDFESEESITVTGLKFAAFTGFSAFERLELEVRSGGPVMDRDDRTINILEKGAEEYYVDANNGTDEYGRGTIDSPWRTLTHALGQVPWEVTTLHVAPGLYDEALGESFPIQLRDGISLEGAGGEATILDATGADETVLEGEAISSLTRVEGLTITGGQGSGGGVGGGIYLLDSAPIISENIIRNNSADNEVALEGAGGGIFLIHSSPTIDNNTIVGNIAHNSAPSIGAGGGIGCTSSSPVITNNLIVENSAYNDASASEEPDAAAAGGGIFVSWMSEAVIENNLIAGNTSQSSGDFGISGGGLAVVYSALPSIRSNAVRGNTGEVVGRGAVAGGAFAIGFSSIPDIRTNTISGNVGSNASLNTASEFNDQVEQGGDAAGGVAVTRASDPVVSRNTITGNSAENTSTGGGAGGGISISYGSFPIVSHNNVDQNSSYASYHGGGINVSRLSGPTINGNYVSGNTSRESRDQYGGGGMGFGPHDQELAVDATLVYNNIIIGNTGNGSDCAGGASIRYGAHPVLENNLIVKNIGWAGGLSGFYNAGFVVRNCTVTDNEGWQGLYTLPTYQSWMNPSVENSIFWSESTDGGIYYAGGGWYAYLSVNYSDVEGASALPGTGNIDADPLFADPSIDDYHITSQSPVVDAGIATEAPAYDIDGDERPVGAGFDMGADEYAETPVIFMVDPKMGYSGTPIEVTVFGTNFEGAVSSRIGDEEIGSFTVTDNTHLVATIPSSLPPGSYDIVVVTTRGESAFGDGDLFTVLDSSMRDVRSQPVVTRVDPEKGYPGASIIISGANLSGATSVKMGTVEMTEWTVDDDGRIAVTVSSDLEPGEYEAYVTTPGGTNASDGLNEFIVLENAGAYYYVDVTQGNDASGAGSALTPWKTITGALSAVTTTGITLRVAAGTYDVASGETFPIILREGISLVGEDVRTTILDASGTGQPVIYGRDISAGSNTVLEGVTITGGEAPDSGGGIQLKDASPIIQQVVIKGNYGPDAGGIHAVDASSPQILNVTVVKNSAAPGGTGGLYCAGQSNPLLKHVTIADNTTGGVNMDFSSLPTILNSIVWGNGGDALWDYNLVTFSDLEPDIVDGLINTREGNISADPLFIDASIDGYHLHGASPAVDAATWVDALSVDIEGDARPFYISGSYYAHDMGSDEYLGVSSAKAVDASGGGPGIQAGDQVVIVFAKGTAGPAVDASTIDDVLELSSAHTWKDGSGAIGAAVWSATKFANDTLTITLSTTAAPPSVLAGPSGDTVTLDGATIIDSDGTPMSGSRKIEGLFGAHDLFLNGDFETGDLTGWNIVRGAAFENQPVPAETIPGAHDAWALQTSDSATGNMTSDPFVFTTGKMRLLLGGTATSYYTEVRLINAGTGSRLLTIEVPDGYEEGFAEVELERLDAIGLPVYLEINDDKNTDVLNIDHIRFVIALASAEAFDASGEGEGLQAGDTITLTFNGPTAGTPVNAPDGTIGGVDIDAVLALSNGHSWKDGAGGLGAGTWSDKTYPNDTLTIVSSAEGGLPTLEPGDTITLDEATALDVYGNPLENPAPVVALEDSFGVLCPDGAVAFEMNEIEGSEVVSDMSTIMTGEVLDSSESFLGDGYFHGDGVDNGLYFADNRKCLRADRTLALEARLETPETFGSGDDFNERIFDNIITASPAGNYHLTLYRSLDSDSRYQPPAGVGTFMFKARVVRGNGAGKKIHTDYDICPVVGGHWYVVKIVWSSGKTGGLPVDIFVDDQGTDGGDTNERWSGYVNCTDWDQSQVDEKNHLLEGDEINVRYGHSSIGVKYHDQNDEFQKHYEGLIDWVKWQAGSDYSGVDDLPRLTPSLAAATASDASGAGEGVQAGDRVDLTFNGGTNGAAIDASNIDTVLELSGGHSWKDGSGAIVGAVWSTRTYANDTLSLTLSDTSGAPSVEVGDVIALDGTIEDMGGSQLLSSAALEGTFGYPSSAVKPIGAEASDASSGGVGIQADDQVVIELDGATGGTTIDRDNIDLALALPYGHSWLDGSGGTGDAIWSSTTHLNDTLTIVLSDTVGPPTVAAGDTVTFAGVVKDSGGAPIVGSVRVDGSFGQSSPGAIVAHWSFEEGSGLVAGDGAGDNHGAIDGAEWAEGRFGSGLRFDGEDDHVIVSSDSNIYGISSAITLEVWASHEALGADVQRYVTTPDEKAVLRYDGVAGQGLDFYLNSAGTLHHLRWEGPMETGLWYHVVGTYDGTVQSLYVNGLEVAAADLSGELSTTAGPSLVSSGGESMSGLLDEVIIYNWALSAPEIAQNHGAWLSSAVARDWSGAGPGTQAGDTVVITFDAETVGTGIDASNVDAALALADGHSWRDGEGGIGDAVWSTTTYANDTLTITLSGSSGSPTVSVGDVIAPGGVILDLFGNVVRGEVVISGSLDYSEAKVLGAVAIDLSGGSPGIQAGDTVFVTFDSPMEGTEIDASNIDTALELSGGGTWLDGAGGLGSADWATRAFTNDTLTITLSDEAGSPPIAVGALVTLTGLIGDAYGSPVIGATELAGSFELPSGAVAYWTFNEGAGDIVTDEISANDGSVVGADWAAGISVGALRFDGVDDYVTTSLEIDQGGSHAYTFEAWVYPASSSSGKHHVISTDSGGYDWSLLRDGATWNVFTGSGSWRTELNVDVGEWQHVVAVFEPGEGIKFYKNGASQASTSTISYDDNSYPVDIGRNPGFQEHFDGAIDEVVIYERALTAAEIMARWEIQFPSTE